MRTSTQVSIAVVMWLVVVAAFELVLFEEFRSVRFLLLIPPITMAILSLNLGILFVVIRPRLLEPRIAGMLLGGVAATFVTVLGLNRSCIPIIENVRSSTLNGPSGLSDQQGLKAAVRRFVFAQMWDIVNALVDILGVAIICAGGWLEHRWRIRRARSHGPAPPVLPLDERAASPL